MYSIKLWLVRSFHLIISFISKLSIATSLRVNPITHVWANKIECFRLLKIIVIRQQKIKYSSMQTTLQPVDCSLVHTFQYSVFLLSLTRQNAYVSKLKTNLVKWFGFNLVMVEPSRIELLTSCVQGRRSPSWAIAPLKLVFFRHTALHIVLHSVMYWFVHSFAHLSCVLSDVKNPAL